MANERLEYKKEKDEDVWSQIPAELLCSIVSNAFKNDVGAIINVQSVCKSWKLMGNIIRSPSPSIDKLPSEYPCFLSLNGDTGQFIHPNHTPFSIKFPELEGALIRFSKYGWLLLSRDIHNFFFFNPFTRDKIELPYYEFGFEHVCFSAPPTSSDCYVIAYDHLTFYVLKRGETQWRNSESLNKIQHPYSHPILLKNHCYIFGHEGNILVLDIKNNTVKIFGQPFPPHYRSYLVECAGELLAVIVPYEEQHIYIQAMNPSKHLRVWRPKNYLRNQMLFVSRKSSFIKQAPVKAASNKIYFPLIKEDNDIIFYSLATNKYHSFLCNYSSGSPSDDDVWELPSNGTWIETMAFAPPSAKQIDWAM